ncbi:MAG: hypothetical protein KY476_08130 [Planctomycetes bacterium]|nr:hypothetical protein [Planctomycetota bacterium]
MTHRLENTVDPIQELRLRRWARRNYVASDQRGANWHPIVLDEMRSRDSELCEYAEETLGRIPPRFVPLEPGRTHAVHPPHEELPEPHILAYPSRRLEYVDELTL